MKIYLAGPIDALTQKEAEEWRIYASRVFMKWDIECINPLRGKNVDNTYTPNEIVHRDLYDIRRADILLANYMRKGVPYIGTSMEIVYAHSWGKPVIVTTDWCDSYWLKYHATAILDNLDKAIEYILGAYVVG